MISTEEFNSLHSFISTKFIPWINELLTKSSDKNTIKIASYLIKEVEESLSSLLPSKNGSKIANFTEFYYKHIDLSQELIDGLQELEKQIFEVIESINEKVQAEEGLRRDPEIIKNIGVVYKQISTSNSMSVKGISFNENKHIFSPLEYKEQKRLETHYLIEVGAITKLLLNLNKANYKKEDAFMSKALERVYKYEEYIAMIPSVQNDVKMLSKPEFIQYFDEYEQTHISKLDSLYLKILQQIKDINSQTEIEVVLRDELVGNIVLFERMANSEVLKKKEQILKILLLVFYGSSVKDEKVTKHVWNV